MNTHDNLRDQVDNLAEVYSLIISIDHVDRAFSRDTINSSDYNEVMSRLLSQYNKLVQDPNVETNFNNLEQFVKQYRIDAPMAIQRIKTGIPATAEAFDIPTVNNGSGDTAKSGTNSLTGGSASRGKSGKAVAEVAGHFITFSDGIHLGFRGKDDLHPLLAELATSLNRVTKENFTGRGKIVEWLIRLNQLKVGEKITDEEAQNCLSDVQTGYHAFLALLD